MFTLILKVLDPVVCTVASSSGQLVTTFTFSLKVLAPVIRQLVTICCREHWWSVNLLQQSPVNLFLAPEVSQLVTVLTFSNGQ